MQTLIESVLPTNPLSIRDRCIVELLYATGLRNQELRTLPVGNVDLTEKTLFVTGKGSKDRIVPVGDWVMPYLLEYLEAARPKLINLREPTELLFVSKNGRMITEANLGDMIKKYARKIGLDIPITPHSFRHACATHLLKGGADIRYVQELLGHSDLSSTQIYTQLDISFLKQAHKKYHPRERLWEEGTE
jgi:integrase/recombinase XerD